MQHTVIETEAGFKILRLSSQCAYGLFETRAEAEAAIKQSDEADQLSRCGQ